MEKYVVSALFVVLIAVTSSFINKFKDNEKEKTRFYFLITLLVLLLGAGGYYAYDEFYLQPKLRKELLAQFLQIFPEEQ